MMAYTALEHIDQLDRWGLPPKGQAEYALNLLVAAREIFKRIDNKRTADRCRAAISSAKGAIRIQASRSVREEMKP